MKELLAILFVCSLCITIESADGLHDARIFVNTYPKKVKTPLKKSIHIINSRKFEKLSTLKSQEENYKKLLVNKKTYTVFAPIAVHKIHDIPEIQQAHINRKRVKKVLPDYGHALFIRKKRSAAVQVNNTGFVNVVEKKKNLRRKKNNKKRIKRKGTNKKKSSSTLKKIIARNRPKAAKEKVKLNKAKKRNNSTEPPKKIRKVRRGNKRPSINFKHNKNLKNESKNSPSGRADILSKKQEARKQKREKQEVTKKVEHEKKVMNRRLVAGRDAMIQDYPYVVSIQKDNQHWCAGALLNPRLVITTANCVWKAKRISRMRVRAGSRHMDRGGQLVKIQEVVKHPSWSIRTLPDNDVALLLLNKNIQCVKSYLHRFSDTVHAIDLPNRAMWPAFEDVWVTSWGAERRDGIFQPMGVTLQVYHAMLLDHEKCNNVTMRFGVAVSRNFICIAQTGRRAPCTRDTGAPAVSDGILWGVASWGIRKL
ncbi:jg14304 [Pararge aegeria aegeria]|uniref:trypsin n=2 Tax=Pararge aegeria aegeria TaxID=348720 RepID=A0A8S4R941_9NEOP|nr:jg14304 [Pararge aegeria aegeria]